MRSINHVVKALGPIKQILIIAGVTIAGSSFALCQIRGNMAVRNSNAEQEVRRLMREWDEAYMRRDTSALDRILADDFSFTDAAGKVSNKMQYIMAIIKSPDMMLIKPFNSDDVNVRVYGDTAVVTGRSPLKGRPRGRTLSDLYRFTDVWVNRQGRWQAVASQVTRIAQATRSK